MSNTKYYNFKGKVFYPKVWESNREMNTYNPSSGKFDLPATDGGRYVLTLEMTESEAQRFKDTGARAGDYIKHNANGNPTVKLQRQHEKRNSKGDILEWASGQPKITGVDKDTPIGNESEVEVRVCVWGKIPTVGCRIESIKVLNLVEYEPDEVEELEIPF